MIVIAPVMAVVPKLIAFHPDEILASSAKVKFIVPAPPASPMVVAAVCGVNDKELVLDPDNAAFKAISPFVLKTRFLPVPMVCAPLTVINPVLELNLTLLPQVIGPLRLVAPVIAVEPKITLLHPEVILASSAKLKLIVPVPPASPMVVAAVTGAKVKLLVLDPDNPAFKAIFPLVLKVRFLAVLMVCAPLTVITPAPELNIKFPYQVLPAEYKLSAAVLVVTPKVIFAQVLTLLLMALSAVSFKAIVSVGEDPPSPIVALAEGTKEKLPVPEMELLPTEKAAVFIVKFLPAAKVWLLVIVIPPLPELNTVLLPHVFTFPPSNNNWVEVLRPKFIVANVLGKKANAVLSRLIPPDTTLPVPSPSPILVAICLKVNVPVPVNAAFSAKLLVL